MLKYWIMIVDDHKPALVILDIQTPGMTGIHVASALRRERPTTAVMFLSMHADDERLFAAIRVGAAAFLTKDTDPAPIIETIHAVLKGENLLHQSVLTNPELTRRVLGEFRSLTDGNGAPAAEVRLSPRELEVLDCVVMGRSNKEIGPRPCAAVEQAKPAEKAEAQATATATFTAA